MLKMKDLLIRTPKKKDLPMTMAIRMDYYSKMVMEKQRESYLEKPTMMQNYLEIQKKMATVTEKDSPNLEMPS